MVSPAAPSSSLPLRGSGPVLAQQNPWSHLYLHSCHHHHHHHPQALPLFPSVAPQGTRNLRRAGGAQGARRVEEEGSTEACSLQAVRTWLARALCTCGCGCWGVSLTIMYTEDRRLQPLAVVPNPHSIRMDLAFTCALTALKAFVWSLNNKLSD